MHFTPLVTVSLFVAHFLYKMNNARLHKHIAHRGYKIASDFYLGFVREFD
jgi:hypothetical protein